ncbi:MAG TPA: permease [Streptosporangiaceae bacterium]|nr:permease [Streptosporangiaceae bacterium]
MTAAALAIGLPGGLAAQHAAAVTAGTVLRGIGDSLRESFFMFWDTLWALILGFGLSGAVQAFAPRESLRAKLGDHRPAAVARASVFGTLSSSCSYAASAMAKSLFAGGADFVTSMIFMFASTNLVIELGIVLVVLIGWQFAIAEYVGGTIMIILLALLGGVFLAGRRVEAARARLLAGDASQPGGGHGHAGHAGSAHPALPTRSALPTQPALPWRARIRTRAGWADAAGYMIGDLTMLRKELVIGFAGAGFLAVLVPTAFWHAFFVQGHGIWTSVENAVVGPFIALISFVCSIGNVPLAAALWQGGISFGGVISFIFADLIALPLVLIYRKFYGGALALRMLAVFWAVMAAAGLATELIFRALGLIPAHRPVQIVPDRVALNYTTVLNIVFLLVFALLYLMYRNRDRLGGGTGYAIDPVCGMQVEKAGAPARASTGDAAFWFCSDRCCERFEADPARFAASPA